VPPTGIGSDEICVFADEMNKAYLDIGLQRVSCSAGGRHFAAENRGGGGHNRQSSKTGLDSKP
jgi:hypothetical protein